MLHTSCSLRSIARALALAFVALLTACSSTHAPELDASSADASATVFAQDACQRALVAFELVDACSSSAFVCPWDADAGGFVDASELEACLDALDESAACDDAAASLATCATGAR